jgi:hypothetical protein
MFQPNITYLKDITAPVLADVTNVETVTVFEILCGQVSFCLNVMQCNSYRVQQKLNLTCMMLISLRRFLQYTVV